MAVKAMMIDHYGEPEVFALREVDRPRPGEGEVLVRVRASSVNPVDAFIRSGALKSFLPLSLPAILGVDVAGEVAELGASATKFKSGERVFAFTGIDRGGGYGEYTSIPEHFLARVPSDLTWAEAGTVPGVGATAYEAFTEHAPVRDGMRVLINGGAGGVGTYAIQIGKALGAEVTVTASSKKSALCFDLGADHVLDYTKEDPFKTPFSAPFDVVLNCVRGVPTAPMLRLLSSNGKFVTIVGNPLEAETDPRAVSFAVKTSGTMLEGLADLMGRGKVRPVLEETYNWNELADAHRRVETGRVAGKLAVLAQAA